MGIPVLLLRFDAPLVSFGAPMVDQNGVVQAMPALSMLTGLVGNALGYRHADGEHLARLQDRLRFAARTDRRGEALVDFQIVDLGKPWMDWRTQGWTTSGTLAERKGASGDGLHIRYRHYHADSVHTVAMTLDPAEEVPTLGDVERALREPARPLFLGRKTCLPSTPILIDSRSASSVLVALAEEPRTERSDSGSLPVWWDEEGDDSAALAGSRAIAVTDERDWNNQVHTGRRLLREGRIAPPSGPSQ